MPEGTVTLELLVTSFKVKMIHLLMVLRRIYSSLRIDIGSLPRKGHISQKYISLEVGPEKILDEAPSRHCSVRLYPYSPERRHWRFVNKVIVISLVSVNTNDEIKPLITNHRDL